MCLEVLCYHFDFRRNSIALLVEVGAITSFSVPPAFTNQFLSWMVEGFAHFELHLCFLRDEMRLKYCTGLVLTFAPLHVTLAMLLKISKCR